MFEIIKLGKIMSKQLREEDDSEGSLSLLSLLTLAILIFDING